MTAPRIDWDRPVEGEFRIDFGTPQGSTKPRRVTAAHVHEFNRLMEQTARTFWENVDKRKPYAVDSAYFRSRYFYVGVDTVDSEQDDEALAAVE